jgi:hypothetical protein
LKISQQLKKKKKTCIVKCERFKIAIFALKFQVSYIMMFSVSTKIKYSYQSEYVTLKDLRVMLLRIGWVGIPIMSQTPLFMFRKNSNKQINLQKTKSLSLTIPYRVEKLTPTMWKNFHSLVPTAVPCGKT